MIDNIIRIMQDIIRITDDYYGIRLNINQLV